MAQEQDLVNLVNKYGTRLPRYTSYPTAPKFSTIITEEIHKNWLSAVPGDSGISLYIHIAYCTEMCWFCGCQTKITRKYHVISSYLETLLTEVDLVAVQLPQRTRVQHIHFGGGSPTILLPEDFSYVVTHLRSRFNVLPNAEIAVEIDPRTTTLSHIVAMAKAGVTRVSIGVQDFNETVQVAINRVQSYALTQQIINELRAHTITSINVDLIYGLPYQTPSSITQTLGQVTSLEPQRLSLFGYAHVPWLKKHQLLLDAMALPEPVERWRQYNAAHRYLVSNGYIAIGLDHYAVPSDTLTLALRKKQLRRNFQGYTDDTATVLLGFGASAISYLPQGYVVNSSEIAVYKQLISTDHLATSRGITLSLDDRVRWCVIERLMCDMSVNLADVVASFGDDDITTILFNSELHALSELEADGIITISDETIQVKPIWRPLVRVVCAVFDRYSFKTKDNVYSKVV